MPHDLCGNQIPTQTLVHTQSQDKAGSATAAKGQQEKGWGRDRAKVHPVAPWRQLVLRASVCPSAGQDRSWCWPRVRGCAKRPPLAKSAGGLDWASPCAVSPGHPCAQGTTGAGHSVLWCARGSSDHQACSYPCPLATSRPDPQGADPASPTASSLGPCSLGRSRVGGGTSLGGLGGFIKAPDPGQRQKWEGVHLDVSGVPRHLI